MSYICRLSFFCCLEKSVHGLNHCAMKPMDSVLPPPRHAAVKCYIVQAISVEAEMLRWNSLYIHALISVQYVPIQSVL